MKTLRHSKLPKLSVEVSLHSKIFSLFVTQQLLVLTKDFIVAYFLREWKQPSKKFLLLAVIKVHSLEIQISKPRTCISQKTSFLEDGFTVLAMISLSFFFFFWCSTQKLTLLSNDVSKVTAKFSNSFSTKCWPYLGRGILTADLISGRGLGMLFPSNL